MDPRKTIPRSPNDSEDICVLLTIWFLAVCFTVAWDSSVFLFSLRVKVKMLITQEFIAWGSSPAALLFATNTLLKLNRVDLYSQKKNCFLKQNRAFSGQPFTTFAWTFGYCFSLRWTFTLPPLPVTLSGESGAHWRRSLGLTLLRRLYRRVRPWL